jgi:formate/nitrite transporter FocA (FNT family)
VAKSPDPSEVFKRAVEEGERRLDQSMLELTSTGFIAGLTIVFGIASLAIMHALVEPRFGELAKLAGALGFGIGMVFLIVGRAELFSENFFDPVATLVVRRRAGGLWRLLRLWLVTFILNLIGGGLICLIIAFDGVLAKEAGEVLRKIAEEIAGRGAWVGFFKAIVGGALVTLLSYLLHAVNSVGSRIIIAYLVGVLLAVGIFDHVIVTILHVLLGILFGAEIGFEAALAITATVTAGNLLGGLGLVTLTHITQAEGARESDG